MKNLVVLGSTGSIGTSTLDIVRKNPERFSVKGLSAYRNVKMLCEQIIEFKPEVVCLPDRQAQEELEKLLGDHQVQVLIGEQGLEELAMWPTSDSLMVSVVGSCGLKPLMSAISAGKDIAFVNKEAMVMAGSLVMEAVNKHQVNLIPVDSEHSAIFQCLNGENTQDVRRLILTSSGGPFREFSKHQLSGVTVEQAIKHPRWSMGPKISVDSATLMNKGLEIIEARWLFDMPEDKIDVLIHPQSTIHSMVEYIDGSWMAQLGVSDMRVAIQYAMTYPQRIDLPIEPLDLVAMGRLDFQAPDELRFEALSLSREACRKEGSWPAVLNAANEVAVDAFLNQRIEFLEILDVIKSVLDAHSAVSTYSLDEIIEIDAWARKQAGQFIANPVKLG